MFSFKSFKASKAPPKSSSPGSAEKKKDKRATTSVYEARYQSGELQGQLSGNHYFVFNPRYESNEAAKNAVEEIAYDTDAIKPFNKNVGGFTVRVHSPKQAQLMHEKLRDLPNGKEDLPARLDVGTWQAGPLIQIVVMENVDLKMYCGTEYEGVTAIILNGPTPGAVYPIKNDFKDIGYEFVYNVHGKSGIHLWTRVVQGKENTDALIKAASAVLDEHGWEYEVSHADANDWSDDE